MPIAPFLIQLPQVSTAQCMQLMTSATGRARNQSPWNGTTHVFGTQRQLTFRTCLRARPGNDAICERSESMQRVSRREEASCSDCSYGTTNAEGLAGGWRLIWCQPQQYITRATNLSCKPKFRAAANASHLPAAAGTKCQQHKACDSVTRLSCPVAVAPRAGEAARGSMIPLKVKQ